MGYNLISYDFAFKDSLPDILFDGIMSNSLIEHLQNPIETFKLFNRMLKPDGVMSHSTDCYEYKIEYTSFHLYFYEGTSLSMLCEQSGFQITDNSFFYKTYKK